jgi:hypothetical protein
MLECLECKLGGHVSLYMIAAKEKSGRVLGACPLTSKHLCHHPQFITGQIGVQS